MTVGQVERLNLLVSANGSVLRSEILGALKMKHKAEETPSENAQVVDIRQFTMCVNRESRICACPLRSYLSGMPELKLGLNDKLLFEVAHV